jgi:hypothetical protein
MVDLVDHEHAGAPPRERRADDVFAVALFVVGRRVDHVQPGVERALQGAHAGLDRHGSIRQVSRAEARGDEAGAAELTPW